MKRVQIIDPKEKRILWVPSQQYPDKIVTAYNLNNEELGCLDYEKVGRHMHWCWYQNQDIRMSPGCLQEVRDKQKELLRQPK